MPTGKYTRTKELVKKLLDTEIPDSKEISEMVQSDVRASEITEYGPEKLSAGPEIASNEELIIVEGRADVLNLLRNDIAYAIAVGGAQGNIPKTIIDLTSQKETTLFVDGDRGGDMIARSILNVAEVDFITKAPDGKEVEDLTRKEIIKALRTRIPIDQYRVIGGSAPQQQVNRFQNSRREQQAQREQQEAARPAPSVAEHRSEHPAPQQTSHGVQDINSIIEDEPEGQIQKIDSKSYEPASKLKPGEKQEASNPILEAQVLSQISSGLDELSGTLRSRFYDSSGNVTKEIPIRELLSEMDYSSGAYAVVLDGVITQRLVELALQKNIKAIYGIKANPLTRKFHDILLYTKEQGKIA